MNDSHLKTDTLSPQRAVQEYLDTLLQEVTAEEEVGTLTAVDTPNPPAVAEVAVPVSAAPVAAEAAVEPQPVMATEQQTIAAPDAEVGTVAPAAREWINGRPPWAQQSFDCLLFRVSGLTLAVPLAELGGVLTLEDDLTPLFGQPDWFLGLQPSKTVGTVKVIDTARWVMPEKYTEELVQKLRYIIRIEGSDWGMACHEVADAISLKPDQVRWRSDRGRRPWLAGTVVEHMCAIMDVKSLVAMVHEDQLQVTGGHKAD